MDTVEPRARSSIPQPENQPDPDPVLQSPDFTRPLLLYTNASDTELGAVLAQGPPSQEWPVVFISRKVQPPEQCYATIEKEALVVKWAFGALQYYLTNNLFTLVVDQTPLQWIERMKDHNTRVLRWYFSLLPFRYTIVHRPGKSHVNADFMSHLFEAPGPSQPLSWGDVRRRSPPPPPGPD